MLFRSVQLKLNPIKDIVGNKVVIGVGAVIAMVAVGNGASVQMQDLVSGLGSNLLILSPGAPRSGGVRQSSGARLTLSDVRAVTEECWSVLRAAPLVNLSAQLIYENQNWPTRVTGTTPSFFDVDNHSIYLRRLSHSIIFFPNLLYKFYCYRAKF